MSTEICDVWLGKLFGPVLTMVHLGRSLNMSQSRNERYLFVFYFCVYLFVVESEEESGETTSKQEIDN